MRADPYRHHRELRDVITPVETSAFRDFDPSTFDAMMAERGLAVSDWRYSAAEREALRQTEMQGRMDRDLWVFAYGSLCWDPAMIFDEVRHAYLPDHARQFLLKDVKGARGNAERPGLMATLADGSGCDGLAFRVPAAHVEAETRNLWARERVAPAYSSAFLNATTAQGEIEVLAFVADPEAEIIVLDMTYEEQVRYVATGEGFLGTSLDYVHKLQAGLKAIGISDPDLDRLVADAESYGA